MSKNFTDLDECLKYFTKQGFKLIRDTQNGATQTLMLRSYSVEEFSEVVIKKNDSGIKVSQTINGKTVTLS